MFHALKSVLKQRGLNTAVGDEGGFAPDLPSNAAALDAIVEAIGLAGLQVGSGHHCWRWTALPPSFITTANMCWPVRTAA
jgi:hypothetical protein